LALVAPDVSDFFEFVDMSENYPSTGTGNVYRFAQGLARIRIQNRILVVLDNDAVGRQAYKQISALTLAPRMKVALLPDLPECRTVQSIGPTGSAECDINGRATSIECFLDIWKDPAKPVVRWTTYVSDIDAWQGELVNKVAYVKSFLDAAKRQQQYDLSGLQMLWNHLLAVCRRA
jgi:hypothetical protein